MMSCFTLLVSLCKEIEARLPDFGGRMVQIVNLSTRWGGSNCLGSRRMVVGVLGIDLFQPCYVG